MKAGYKLGITVSALLLLAYGLLYSTQNVSAAADGKISGTVKLDGTAPHMKPIDMSKDPVCVKAHEGHPAVLENVIVGQGGGLENVVLYLSEGLPASAASEDFKTLRRLNPALPEPTMVEGSFRNFATILPRRTELSAPDG